MSKEHIEKGLHFPKADLAALAELALERLPVSFTSALEEAKLTGVDATIVCHLDPRVQQEVHRFLGGKAGRPVAGKLLYSFGASLPLALGAALEGGDVVEGETVALLTAGSGASWGAGIIRT